MYQTDCVAQLGAARLHSLTAVNVRRSRLLNKVAVSLYSLYSYQKFLFERESLFPGRTNSRGEDVAGPSSEVATLVREPPNGDNGDIDQPPSRGASPDRNNSAYECF